MLTPNSSFWGVFWVDYSNEASARVGFKRIAGACDWPITDDTDVIDTVNQRIASLQQPSLLVLDNCDELERDYFEWLPSGGQARVIVTTRQTESISFATSDQNAVQDVEKLEALDSESAIELVFEMCQVQTLKRNDKQEAAMRMAETLCFHPLAITTGANFVETGGCSIEEYPAVFDSKKKRLMQYAPRQAKSKYGNVYATFKVSAQALQVASEPAAKHALELLDMEAFMDRRDISEDIFLRAWAQEEFVIPNEHRRVEVSPEQLSPWHVAKSRSFLADTLPPERIWAFREARRLLCQLSLGSLDTNIESLALHPLIHDWVRIRIQRDLLYERWIVVASTLALSAENTKGEECPIHLQRHLDRCAAAGLELECFHGHHDGLEQLKILLTFAWRLWSADSAQIIPIAQKLGGDGQKMSGLSEHTSEWCGIHFLIGILSGHAGEYVKMRNVLQDLVNIKAASVPPGDPYLLILKRTLASTLLFTHQTDEAIVLLESVWDAGQALEENKGYYIAHEQALGMTNHEGGRGADPVRRLSHAENVSRTWENNHLDWVAVQYELGRAYLANGQTSEAVTRLEHVVETRKALPESHPKRLDSQHLLAEAYYEDHREEESVELLVHVVRIQKALSKEHFRRVRSERVLAMIRSNMSTAA